VLGLTSAGVSAPVLGGIDRSTMAVIEPSPLANGGRPTMVYVGGLDGMLHAVCASVQGACTELGVELWAFIPRTQLPALRTNTAMVNGTPRVADIYGDFDGSGDKDWRTILTFQTGAGDPSVANATPSVFALDVTDPTDPTIVWEYSTPASRSEHELGVGLNLAMGPVKVGSLIRDVTFAQTNNGGTGGAGTSVFAIETQTGSVLWKWSYLYPAARSVGEPVPASGIPGGVAAADLADSGAITDLVVATLYGNLFQLSAATGRSRYGAAPSNDPCLAPACVALYQFTTDHHPIGAAPTIYSDGLATHVAVGSGSYADNSSNSGTGTTLAWSPATTSQYLIGISLASAPATTPLTATTPSGLVRIASDLGAGVRVNAQAQVSGDEIFLTTESLNANDITAYGVGATDTGKVLRIALATGTTTSSTDVAGGAGAVDVSGGAAYIASGKSTRTVTSGTSAGVTVEKTPEVTIDRLLWLSQ
jgi:type IV pilus assembly protein PilY1